MPDLIVENVSKQFPTRGEPLVVLRGVSLVLSRGESVVILGPSGSGKSTLLHIMGTLDRPTAGRVALNGVDPANLSEPELADFRNSQIGFVFQDHHLLPQCSVLENVLLPTVAQGGPDETAIGRAKMLIERVGLAGRIEHRPAELSGGERQRVAVARALVRRPVLLLADEPTGNLDRSTSADVAKLLLDLHRSEQTMMVIVTHNIELARLFDRQFELDAGTLAATKS